MSTKDDSEALARQQKLRQAYEQGGLGFLLRELDPERLRQFCRVVVEQAQAECARSLGLVEAYANDLASRAVEAAGDWGAGRQLPWSTPSWTRYEDFYNPFWTSFTATSGNIAECVLGAAYYMERTLEAAAWEQDGLKAAEEAVMVADMAAQATGGDRLDAREVTRRWQIELAWALIHHAAPPAWPG